MTSRMFGRMIQALTGHRMVLNEQRPAENPRKGQTNKPRFPKLETRQSIWILTSRIRWKTVGIIPGDNPINKGRIAFMWVKKVKGN